MRLLSIPLLLSLAGVALSQIPTPPLPVREFRGAWIATVGGIDFPHHAGAPAKDQQKELLGLIDRAAALKLNALIFQVRPMGDAFYKSSIEPWSPFLTGEMGRAPDEAWDPLEFAIKAAHARGMELHAWFNPFRALAGTRYAASGAHLSKEHPEWCWQYGSNIWMDPGERGVRERAKMVMMDVLERYDVDGIHIDDYFYPYPVKSNGVTMEFPDDRSWMRYQESGGKLTRQEWRRANVDGFVEDLYQSVKQRKPYVRFGISPFGLWRPNFPEGFGKGALDPYDELGADSLKWLKNGWCDYFAPQLYWPIQQRNLSFTSLFDWWLSQNSAHRYVWPGMASDRVISGRQSQEILREIGVSREHQLDSSWGHIHWNFGALSSNRGKLADLMDKQAYSTFALPPSYPWLGQMVPAQPEIIKTSRKVQWQLTDFRSQEDVRWWLIQTFEKGKWSAMGVLPAAEKEAVLKPNVTAVAVRGIGLTGLAGVASVAW